MSPEPRGPSEAVLTNKISESHRFQNTGVNAVQGSLLDLAVVMTSHLLSPGRTGNVHVFLTNRGSPHIYLGHHRTLTGDTTATFHTGPWGGTRPNDFTTNDHTGQGPHTGRHRPALQARELLTLNLAKYLQQQSKPDM